MSQFFEVDKIGDVAVVSFKKNVVSDLEDVGIMGEGIASSIVLMIENGCQKFIIDFGVVEFLHGDFLAHLISLKRKFNGSTKIVLCGLNQQPYDKFLETKIYQLFTIVKDKEEAFPIFQQ